MTLSPITDEMVRLYSDEGLTMREVGIMLGCSHVTVHNHLHRLGVTTRRKGRCQKRPPPLDHDEIAAETGVPAETVATVASAVVERLMGRR